MVSVKKFEILSSFVFVLSEIGLKRMLSCGLEGKEAFQDDKHVNFVKCEKWVPSKEVNPSFWSKI